MKLKIKKGFVLMLSVFMVGSVSVTGNAEDVETEGKVVTYSKNLIKDVDTLYHMAKSGISDVVENPRDVATITNQDTGEKETLETMSTTQLVEIKQDKSTSEETYVKTTFIKPNEESESSSIITPFSSISDNKWDKTSGVKAYSTIQYTSSSGDGKFTYLKMSSVSGGWTIQDKQIQITGRYVKMNQYGRISGKQIGVTNTTSKKPTSNSFSYSAPSSWPAVGRGSIGFDFGVGTTANLKRATSKWDLTFYNHL